MTLCGQVLLPNTDHVMQIEIWLVRELLKHYQLPKDRLWFYLFLLSLEIWKTLV